MRTKPFGAIVLIKHTFPLIHVYKYPSNTIWLDIVPQELTFIYVISVLGNAPFHTIGPALPAVWVTHHGHSLGHDQGLSPGPGTGVALGVAVVTVVVGLTTGNESTAGI